MSTRQLCSQGDSHANVCFVMINLLQYCYISILFIYWLIFIKLVVIQYHHLTFWLIIPENYFRRTFFWNRRAHSISAFVLVFGLKWLNILCDEMWEGEEGNKEERCKPIVYPREVQADYPRERSKLAPVRTWCFLIRFSIMLKWVHVK